LTVGPEASICPSTERGYGERRQRPSAESFEKESFSSAVDEGFSPFYTALTNEAAGFVWHLIDR
jgi:hypothetical protein